MKILVYGAGVLGCQLAHMLAKKRSNQVALVARGEWARTLETQGLRIRHSMRLCTTVDRLEVLEQLSPERTFDLIFVVMQYGQVRQVLPALAANRSRCLVFVGNNMDAAGVARELQALSSAPKEIAFGFYAAAGRREPDRVVGFQLNGHMTVGAPEGPMSAPLRRELARAGCGTGLRMTAEPHMDAWLKCHAAFILPVCYLCYAQNGDLTRVDRLQIEQAVTAADEANRVLKAAGYPLRPDGQEEAFTTGRTATEKMLYLMAKTPLGRLCASDHAMHAQEEMQALEADFLKLRMQTGVSTPTLDGLRAVGCPWMAL